MRPGAVEFLILINVDTLADGEPRNNFLSRALTWNPRGALIGARHATVAGNYVNVATPAGLAVANFTDPPDSQPKFYGFSPEPRPQWIAGYATGSKALALSRGLERDRAVDESGGQVAVFGRIGSRPFTLPEMQRMYLDKSGQPWTVSDR